MATVAPAAWSRRSRLGSTASFEQRYFDFGADVDIQVPEGDVPDVGALFEQLSGLGG